MKNKLIGKIENKESGILFYGLTPPKVSTETSKVLETVQKQKDRLNKMDIDGVVIYDLQDESSRTQVPRPFPFNKTIPPEEYGFKLLADVNIPKIIYKSVGQFDQESFEKWVSEVHPDFLVLVGSPSKHQMRALSLDKAYQIFQSKNNRQSSLLGGIAIPERHSTKHDEHIRIEKKKNQGCNFFISQCVYDVNGAKNFLSDYYYHNHNAGNSLSPIIFSLTPCGSIKTLEFSKWLGIQVPIWLENDLYHANNILEQSVKTCLDIATELIEFCEKKNIPIGFNIESIAIRKEEIEASVELLSLVKKLFV